MDIYVSIIIKNVKKYTNNASLLKRTLSIKGVSNEYFQEIIYKVVNWFIDSVNSISCCQCIQN